MQLSSDNKLLAVGPEPELKDTFNFLKALKVDNVNLIQLSYYDDNLG